MDAGTALDLVKVVTGIKLLEMVYIDLAKPGVKKAGKALETVLDLGNTLLLPIKLLNAKTNLIFKNNMDKYIKRIEEIPDNELFDVPPEIGIPILEKFTYVRSEEISNLFIELLAKASSSETINEAHPSYLNIINNLSVDEANILNYLFNNESVIADQYRFPYFNYVATAKGSTEFIKTLSNFTGIETKMPLLFPQNILLYLNNLVSNGILECVDSSFLVNKDLYDELDEIYKDNKFHFDSEMDKDKFGPMEIEKGYYMITSLGRSFINTCTNNWK